MGNRFTIDQLNIYKQKLTHKEKKRKKHSEGEKEKQAISIEKEARP